MLKPWTGQLLKTVQMASQSQFFHDFYLLFLMRLPCAFEKCTDNERNNLLRFLQKAGIVGNTKTLHQQN